MKSRIIVLSLLMTLSLACATSPPAAPAPDLRKQLDGYIDAYYNKVAGLCTSIHGRMVVGEGTVDCAIRGNEMHMSFPSQAYRNDVDHVAEIRQMFSHWCAAHGAKHGKPGAWVDHSRLSRSTQRTNCPTPLGYEGLNASQESY